jgi:hypothetical protein
LLAVPLLLIWEFAWPRPDSFFACPEWAGECVKQNANAFSIKKTETYWLGFIKPRQTGGNIAHFSPRALTAIRLLSSSRVACSICAIDWEMPRNIAFSIVKTVTYFRVVIY